MTEDIGRRPSFNTMFLGIALASVALLATFTMTGAVADEIAAREDMTAVSVAVAEHLRARDGCAMQYEPPPGWTCNRDGLLCTQPVDCAVLSEHVLGSRIDLARLGDGRTVLADELVPIDDLKTRLWIFRLGWLIVLFGVGLAVSQAMKVRRWARLHGADADTDPA